MAAQKCKSEFPIPRSSLQMLLILSLVSGSLCISQGPSVPISREENQYSYHISFLYQNQERKKFCLPKRKKESMETMSDAFQSTIKFQNSEKSFGTRFLIGLNPDTNYGDWLKARNPRRNNRGYGEALAAGIRNTEPRKLPETENEAGKHHDRSKQPRPETENVAGNQSLHNSSSRFSNWNGRGVRTAGSQRGQSSTVNTDSWDDLSEEEEGEGQFKEKASTEKEKGKGKEKVVLEVRADQDKDIAEEGFLNTNEDGPHHSFDHNMVTNVSSDSTIVEPKANRPQEAAKEEEASYTHGEGLVSYNSIDLNWPCRCNPGNSGVWIN